MPPSIEQYLQELLGAIAASPIVRSSNVELDKRTARAALICGELQFTEGSTLYFRELIELEAEVTRRMYSYHYQGEDASLVFRYDDTPHFPELDSFPHHKHVGGESRAASSAAPDLRAVLREIEAVFPLSDHP
jgi:Family of unknown function (DUF6516)